MCGIAGIVAAHQSAGMFDAPLARMTASLRHRGPDDEGRDILSSCGDERSSVLLGNTRLAILDLSKAGHQPMRDPATGNCIVLNGEIYNHREVREALRDRAGPWTSGSDTETVLKAYAAWGPDCVQTLRGMFSIALWDAAEGIVWCARDRLGIKPFYYHVKDGIFLFASEVRAMLASGLVERRVNRHGLAGFIRFGSVPEPLTLIEGVASLPAAHWVRIRAGKIEEMRQYWRPDATPFAKRPWEAAWQVRAHLKRAVREHMLSDVPVACFLSGGIDSSIITALAAQASRVPIRTFTVGFEDSGLDESRYAQLVADRYCTEHQGIFLSDADVCDLLPKAVSAMDLPSADGLNSYIVSHAVARAGSKVVLSGLGGDELFGGYRSFNTLPSMVRWAPLLGHIPRTIRRWAAGGGGTGARAAEMTTSGIALQDRYESLRSFWSQRELQAMAVKAMVGYAPERPDSTLPLKTQLSRLELGCYMRSTLLRDGDVMSMAHSLEMRLPFLDHELVGYCLRVGAADSGADQRKKALLLDAAGDLLPPEIVARPKQGFDLPMDRWMRGPLHNFVAQGLERLDQTAVLSEVDTVKLRRQFEAGRLQWARLWQFVVLGHWLHLNLEAAQPLIIS